MYQWSRTPGSNAPGSKKLMVQNFGSNSPGPNRCGRTVLSSSAQTAMYLLRVCTMLYDDMVCEVYSNVHYLFKFSWSSNLVSQSLTIWCSGWKLQSSSEKIQLTSVTMAQLSEGVTYEEIDERIIKEFWENQKGYPHGFVRLQPFNQVVSRSFSEGPEALHGCISQRWWCVD